MEASPVTTGVNVYFVAIEGKNYLIDTGGAGFTADLGSLFAGLDAAGIAPSDIDAVLMTDGKAAFPNADLHVHANEIAYFSSSENRAKAAEPLKANFDGAKTVLAAYGDRVRAFSGEVKVVRGIRTRELFGHTPGHSGYVVGYGDEALFVWGDIVHVGPIQMARPDVGIAFDVDGTAAIETRQRVLEEVARNRTRIEGVHISFPGIGHVRTLEEGRGYEFEPSPWAYSVE